MNNTSQNTFTSPCSSIFAQRKAYERQLCINKSGRNTKRASLMIKLLEKMYDEEPTISIQDFYNLTYNNIKLTIYKLNKSHPVFHLEKITDNLWQVIDKRQIHHIL